MTEGHAPDPSAGPDYGMILAGLLPSDPDLDDDGFYQVKWRGAEPPSLWEMKP